jgi:hypothetical protein
MPNPTEQELQTQQMQKMMVWMSPLMIGYFALNVPAGLGLYWFIGNCVGIIQQYLVVGWGNLLPNRSKSAPPPIDAKRAGGGQQGAQGIGPKSISGGSPNGPKNGPQNGAAKNGPQNGARIVPQPGRNRKKRKR